MRLCSHSMNVARSSSPSYEGGLVDADSVFTNWSDGGSVMERRSVLFNTRSMPSWIRCWNLAHGEEPCVVSSSWVGVCTQLGVRPRQLTVLGRYPGVLLARSGRADGAGGTLLSQKGCRVLLWCWRARCPRFCLRREPSGSASLASPSSVGGSFS